MISFMENYSNKLYGALQLLPQGNIELFFNEVLSVWQKNAQIFICGNGGSGANALHIANDLFYGVAKGAGKGIKVHALTANQAIMTCFANDLSYKEIFSQQLEVLANPGDMLIAFSGSGNSPNILDALEKAKTLKMTSCAILGYSGGAALGMSDIPIHVPVDDMQISEDAQVIICHALMQWLNGQNPYKNKRG